MNLETIKTGLENNELGFENVIVVIEGNNLLISGNINNGKQLSDLTVSLEELEIHFNGFKMSKTYKNQTLEEFIIGCIYHIIMDEK